MLHLPAARQPITLMSDDCPDGSVRRVQVRVLVILIRNQERKEERRERKRR